MKPLPNCTGQRIGRLVVLGKGAVKHSSGRNRQLWRLECDCGRVIEIPRGDFNYGKRISCGCARGLGLIDNNRRPTNIAGQRFGSLVAQLLSGKKDRNSKPTWLMQCDCGNTCLMSLSNLRRQQYYGVRINCRVRDNHSDAYLHYPPIPNPYPLPCGELLKKYLPLTELDYARIDSAVEDEKRDRLLRAAWIITYRRWQGEQISELHESRYIRKHLRYCSIDVFWRRKLESEGGLLYNANNSKKQIGDTMTNIISSDYPAIETQGIKSLPKCAVRKLRFKRR